MLRMFKHKHDNLITREPQKGVCVRVAYFYARSYKGGWGLPSVCVIRVIR